MADFTYFVDDQWRPPGRRLIPALNILGVVLLATLALATLPSIPAETQISPQTTAQNTIDSDGLSLGGASLNDQTDPGSLSPDWVEGSEGENFGDESDVSEGNASRPFGDQLGDQVEGEATDD